MPSAVILSVHSYPALPLARQLVHQWNVHPGPLVLGATLLKSPAPTADRDRTVSRRSKPSSRTSLNGEQPYPWDLLQPQDERPPQSNSPPRRVPDPDDGPRLDNKSAKGGISRVAPRGLASPAHSLPPILHIAILLPMRSWSKGAWGLSV